MRQAKFYTIEPYEPPMTPTFATAAIRECALCRRFVDSSGGGGRRALCAPCVEDIETGNIDQFVDVDAIRAWHEMRETKS